MPLTVQDLDKSQRVIRIVLRQDPLDYIFEQANPLPVDSRISPEIVVQEGFSTKQKGRGQGLFIVQRLTERLGGNINIDTANCQFKVTIEMPQHRLEG